MNTEESVKFILINTIYINKDLMHSCLETSLQARVDGSEKIADELQYQAIMYRKFIDKLEARVAALEDK